MSRIVDLELVFVLPNSYDVVDTSTLLLLEWEVELAIHGILKKEGVNTTPGLDKLRF
jgi:hypothetical protein